VIDGQVGLHKPALCLGETQAEQSECGNIKNVAREHLRGCGTAWHVHWGEEKQYSRKVGAKWDFLSRTRRMGRTSAHKRKSGQQQCRMQKNAGMYTTLGSSSAMLPIVMDVKTMTQSVPILSFNLVLWTERQQVKVHGGAVCLQNSLTGSKYRCKSWWLWKECLTKH